MYRPLNAFYFVFRLALAAIHFNENCGRAQAVTKTGELRYTVSFPKAKKGEGVAKEVKVDQSFGKIFVSSYILK